MTSTRSHLRAAVAGAALAAVVSCGKKEPPPTPVPVEQPPATTAPATTLPPPTTVPTPPPIWREASWGMTKKEVLAAFPGQAETLARPAAFGEARAGAGTLEGSTDIAIPAWDDNGIKYRVLFGFDGDALNRVHLAASKAGIDTCTDLEKSITQKHAAPSSRENREGSLKGEQVVWKRPDQTITLTCAGVASLGFQTVTLDYAAPPGAAPR
jgi:hypothetical protein